MEKIQDLWDQGYSAIDVVVTIFRVVKASDKMPEYTKLEFIKVLQHLYVRLVNTLNACGRKSGGLICVFWKGLGRLFNWAD
jgi:DNA polymerase III delta prime subunit